MPGGSQGPLGVFSLEAVKQFRVFSMNNTVTVTGMEVKTTVSDNLLIAGDTIGSTTKLADDNFGTSLTQSVKAILEPSSTVDGKEYWYTVDAVASGKKATGASWTQFTSAAATGANAASYYDKFSQDYNVTKTDATGYLDSGAHPYVDYVFQLKAVNGGVASEIRLTQLNFVYEGASDPGTAFRVATFVEDITGGTATAAAGTLTKIYSESTAENFTAGQAVSGATTTAAVATTNNVIAEIAANTTKYYKVVVRLWLEGEDTTCKNDTYMTLTDEWDLNLELKLVAASDSTAGNVKVANITKSVTTPPSP